MCVGQEDARVSSDEDRRSGKGGGSEAGRGSGDDRRRGADRRRETRIKRRIPCEVLDGDKRVRGFVLDVSPKGMFVQSLKPIQPGGEIGIVFTPPKLGQTIEVRASVVRSLRVPRHLASVASAGVGLRINMAPSEYFDFLASLTYREDKAATAGGSTAASEEPEKPKPKKRKLPPRMPKPETETDYRVQAKQTGGSRSRSLVVSATSREHAESQALKQLGSDWKIVGVKGA
jgi:hypothetical protein